MIVYWTKRSLSDLESIFEFISKDSEYYARRFIEKIINTTDNLTSFPGIGRNVVEVDDQNIKEIIMHNYRIIYTTDNNKIYILSVLHCSRDLTNKEHQKWEVE